MRYADVGIPGYSGDSFMFKIKSEFNPIYQTVNFMQSTHVIYQSNPPIWATWRSKGFRIHHHIAEKRGTLLLKGTFGHTV